MRNPFDLAFSGVRHIIGNIFGAQLDFLSGKSCNSLCGSTWDLPCYIENFCIDHLLKFFAVLLLLYIVLLLFYFIYKLGVCHCILGVVLKMVLSCFSAVINVWAHGCRFMCHILSNMSHRRRRHLRNDIEMAEMSTRSDMEDVDVESSVSFHREGYRHTRRLLSRKDHKGSHFRRSLKPKNHRVHVGVDGGDAVYATKRKRLKHDDVRVIRTSSYAKKGPRHKKSTHGHKKKRDF